MWDNGKWTSGDGTVGRVEGLTRQAIRSHIQKGMKL